MPRAPRLPNIRVDAPLVDGKEQSALCPKGCGTYLVFKPDAIGRLQERCPSCDGVSRRTALHPSHQATQQALVPVTRVGEYVLPPIDPGQLRCQRCAHGVEGNARYCVCCVAILTAPKPKAPKRALPDLRCERCEQPIARKRGRPMKIHDECLTPAEWAQRKAKRAAHDRAKARVA